ncbi:hypothetical protein FJV41_10905 [Myxococcus llanfairpwllgwyngyllgogerychwyrndrobwllllantysiliogogogochensis]|uniref:Lipoprotein n=1 Tax=Myxococcus llanfairpwllgwyngyllgogerychwyrndrobwllllantysiliogogogochensis TaxID=2590453 RepID=A0A540X5H1_9BACT|nr:hypothetical protein [Myxococcus llanfairpwllgwyngyllgogerychwyrndrobwllllantysiliogogogochensis]TQF15974.1 hypothetical protein FJV41_10905 [Myxococcus llanfairpwllgwyngyllgogerychwyrndrobwllllantysiliogogogochensis]
MTHRIFLLVLLTAQALIGCGGDAVSYSAPVGINLKAKSSDTVNATVTSQKGISTESGNPFKVFVDTAREKLNGRQPSRVELASLTLTLGAASVGVASLDEVFTGRVDILFLTEESNNTYFAGHLENPTGSGPVPFIVDFDSEAMAAEDYTRFLAGKFNVVLRGSAAPSFTSKGANVDFQSTFSFTAFE